LVQMHTTWPSVSVVRNLSRHIL